MEVMDVRNLTKEKIEKYFLVEDRGITFLKVFK